jgi:hypothetical protein
LSLLHSIQKLHCLLLHSNHDLHSLSSTPIKSCCPLLHSNEELYCLFHCTQALSSPIPVMICTVLQSRATLSPPL